MTQLHFNSKEVRVEETDSETWNLGLVMNEGNLFELPLLVALNCVRVSLKFNFIWLFFIVPVGGFVIFCIKDELNCSR